MSYSSDVGATIPSTVSVSVRIESTLGTMEKIDRAIQTDEFKIFSFKPRITREERESSAQACYICGSTNYWKKHCPLRTSDFKQVEHGGELLVKHRRSESIVETKEVPSLIAILIESAPKGPRI